MQKDRQDNRTDSTNSTAFGFRQVPVGDKQGLVRGVFDSVADNYDVMNDVMSVGLHRLWKNRMIDALHLPKQSNRACRMVDIAGGTGDIAFRACDRAARLGLTLNVQVIDANAEMLRVGRDRARFKQAGQKLDFIVGNAESLPLDDASVDFYTIAFGIRNVTHRDRALAEARRVLRPGGRFVCLEFSQLPSRPLQRAYDAYSFNIIPRLGGLVANDADSYQYLVESIRTFPAAPQFKAELQAAGLDRCAYQHLTGGIAALHCGWRI